MKVVKHKTLTDEQVYNLYYILESLDNIFKKLQIEYSIFCGTLLGAYRNGGLIPWDDDCDIVIMNKDYHKTLTNKFKDMLEEYNLSIDYVWHGYKISVKTSVRNPYDELYPYVDIFCLRYIPQNDRYEYWFREDYANSSILHNELYPLKTCKFGSLELPCPNDIESYLKREYGDDVLTHYYEMYDHWNGYTREKKVSKLIDIEVCIPDEYYDKSSHTINLVSSG